MFLRYYLLEKWSVGFRDNNPFMAPEMEQKCLHGLREGDRITTSTIVSVEGRKITTYSGSIYILGAIDPEYLTWMKENGIEYDEENPIKFRKAS